MEPAELCSDINWVCWFLIKLTCSDGCVFQRGTTSRCSCVVDPSPCSFLQTWRTTTTFGLNFLQRDWSWSGCILDAAFRGLRNSDVYLYKVKLLFTNRLSNNGLIQTSCRNGYHGNHTLVTMVKSSSVDPELPFSWPMRDLSRTSIEPEYNLSRVSELLWVSSCFSAIYQLIVGIFQLFPKFFLDRVQVWLPWQRLQSEHLPPSNWRNCLLHCVRGGSV